jgi:hypothetical protein
MLKKLALFIGGVGIIVTGVVAFLAFESYTLDINAHLEPVLSVNPHGDWDMGTVYPETDRSTKLFIGLSNSAKADPNFLSVAYTFGCQKKDGASAGALSLCPHIEAVNQDNGVFVQCTQDDNACKWFDRSIVVGQNKHGYAINILFPDCEDAVQKVPFPVKTLDCNFDPITQKYAGVDLAAMISVQVLDIDQIAKCITKKDGTSLPDCVKLPQGP